jgi:hypothetical protein
LKLLPNIARFITITMIAMRARKLKRNTLRKAMAASLAAKCA